ncbi:MAG TPA: glycosyltransferase, partial [Acidimicrobiales bacterium]
MSAILMARDAAAGIGRVIDHLHALPVDEVVVVDNGSTDGTAEEVLRRAHEWEPPRRLEVVHCAENIGVAARNLAIERARGELLLLVDDDSYPLPGTIERLQAAFDANPRLAVTAGMVLELDEDGMVRVSTEPGSFDWMMRAGAQGTSPVDGFPTYFFPEGASMARRQALSEVGGYYEKFFFMHEGFELVSRLLAHGWDVRYVPDAPFHHLAGPKTRDGLRATLRLGVRNHLWYFWLRFPPSLAARRMAAYAAYDLVQCTYRRVPDAWVHGVLDAWRQRAVVRPDRAPLPRAVVRRAELRRGRMHVV